MSAAGTVSVAETRERWISLSVATVTTAVLFLVLPVLNRAVTPQRPDKVLREVSSLRLPGRVAPAAMAAMTELTARHAPSMAPVPELSAPQPLPLRVELPLISDVSGPAISAFTPSVQSLSFGLAGEGAGAWEIEEIDAIPEPLARLEPIYPAHARLRRMEGAVVLQFVVEADGTTSGVEIVSSDPPGVFDAVASRAVERWRFRPGTKDGQAVPVRVRQRMTFKLENGE
jgi:TonB family protein